VTVSSRRRMPSWCSRPGAFAGSMFFNAPQAMFTRYDLKNVKTVSYEVVSNRPKVNSFRAPCVPQVVFGVEGVVNELAQKIGMDPLDLRIKNAAAEGYKRSTAKPSVRSAFWKR